MKKELLIRNKNLFVGKQIWLLLLLFFAFFANAQTTVYTGSFSNSTGGTNAYGSRTISLSSQTWLASSCYFASSEFRLGYGSGTGSVPSKFFASQTNGSSIEMQWDVANAKTIAFTNAGSYGTILTWYVFESTDSGSNWTQVASSNYSNNSTITYTVATPKASARYALVVTGTTPRAILTTVDIKTAAEPANHIAFTTAPTTTSVGSLNTYAVTARGSGNLTDTSYTGTVTLSKVSGPGTVGGTLSKAAVSGVATFNDITFSSAGTYVLQATSGSFPSVQTGNITVSSSIIYTKISSLAEMTDGEYVIIANSTRALNNDNTTTANKLGATVVSVSSNQVVNPPSSVIWTIATVGGNKTIYNTASDRYIAGGGANTNLTLSATATTTSQQWSASFASNLFRFLNAAQQSRGLVLSGTSPFGQYAVSNVDGSTYFDLILFKKSLQSYTATFNANGGTGTMVAQTASTSTNLTANSFIRTGYTFTGWNTEANGSGTAYANQASYSFTADVTLYAQWAINAYDISYDGNGNTGGTAPTKQNGNYNTAVTLLGNAGSLVRTGYTFQGWNTLASGTGTRYNVGASYTIPASNTTLYADWLKNSPVLTTSGTITSVSTVYGQASAEQSFTFTGTDLTGSSITVTPPSGFEVSKVSGTGYTASVSFPISAGSTSGTVFIRVSATSPVGASYTGSVTVSDGTSSKTLNVPICAVTPKELSIVGLSGQNKIYDQTTSAVVLGTPQYSGLVNGETFTVSTNVTWAFPDKNVGSDKILVRNGDYAAPSANYTVNQPVASASITKRNITLTSIVADDKVYDGTATAFFSDVQSSDVFSSDDVVFSASGNFSDANAGENKKVTVLNVILSGNDGMNYNVPVYPIDLTANINKANQIITVNNFPTVLNVGESLNLSTYASSSSLLAVSYSSSAPVIANIASGRLNANNTGFTTISFSQSGDNNYNPAPLVQRAIEVVQIPVPLAQWDFYNVTSSPSLVTLNATNVSSSLGANSAILSRGSGASGSDGSNSFETQGFQNDGISVSNTDYFQTSFTASTNIISLTSVRARVAGTDTFVNPGVDVQFAYSFNENSNYVLINTPSNVVGNGQIPDVSLSGVSALQNIKAGTRIYFRFYASGGNSTGSYGFSSPAQGAYGLEFYGILKPTQIIWDGSSWSNYNGPDASQDALIDGAYVQAEGVNPLQVNNLSVTSNGSVDIQANQGITVNGDITAPDNAIVIESDGSLVQAKIANGNGAVKIIAKRNVNMRTNDYTYWSSPVAGQPLKNTVNGNAENSSGGFSPGTPNSLILQYNEVNDFFYVTNDATFLPAKGYAIRGKSTYGASLKADELTFRGVLHNGDYNIPVQKSKSTIIDGEPVQHGYNLIGNPYPSNIDWTKLYALSQGSGKRNSDVISATVWFWTNTPGAPETQGGSSYSGNNYATLNLLGGAPATGSDDLESPEPNQFIKVGQGFIVQVATTPPTGNTPDVATVKFDNSIRTNDSSGVFYNNNKNSNTVNRYWLKLTSPYKIVNTILLGHLDDATDAYDANYDAELFAIGDDSFYSILNAKKLQIQARKNPLTETDVIELGTKYSVSGTYKISLGKSEGAFASNQKIYLKDKLNNTYTDLTSQDYSFSAIEGVDESRFQIVYKSSEVLETGASAKSDFIVYKDGTDYVVTSSKVLGKVEIYDGVGRLVQSSKTSNKSIRIDSSSFINGIYIIKVENSGDIRTKKVIK